MIILKTTVKIFFVRIVQIKTLIFHQLINGNIKIFINFEKCFKTKKKY